MRATEKAAEAMRCRRPARAFESFGCSAIPVLIRDIQYYVVPSLNRSARLFLRSGDRASAHVTPGGQNYRSEPGEGHRACPREGAPLLTADSHVLPLLRRCLYKYVSTAAGFVLFDSEFRAGGLDVRCRDSFTPTSIRGT